MNTTSLEQKLGCTFRNKKLLTEALTHRSYLNENRTHGVAHNERLEFLGDAVLQIIVTEHLFRHLPGKTEGELTEIRSHLVNSEMASKISGYLGVEEVLLLSRGERRDFKSRKTILANAFEAILGAIYLDQGPEKAGKVVERLLLEKTPLNIAREDMTCPKTLFQEQIQEKLGITPSYQVVRESGPDHDKKFVMGVYLGRSLVAEGSGPSKAEAEKEAAKKALELIPA